MNENVFARYLKEHLLEVMQILAHVGDLPKKHVIGDKIESLGFRKVGHESGQLGVTWLMYFIMSSKTRKYQSQHVLLYPKE
jgi:hypothetical protein